MIAGGASVARTGLIVFLAVLLQVSGFGPVYLLGGHLDLVPLAVGGVAFYAGSVPGALTGFATGMLLDVIVGGQLGASALVLTAVGYGVGRLRELRDPAHGLAPIPVGASATAGYLLATAVVSFMLGFEGSVSILVLRETIMTILLNSLLAIPVFRLIARILRPSLLADPMGRRRRARARDSGPVGLRGLEV